MALMCLTLWIKPSGALSQPLTDSTANYFTLTDYYDNYYDSLIQLRGSDSMKGTGYKDYLRWKWFYSTRRGADGDIGEMWESIQDYYDNFQPPQGYTDNSDWQFFGPIGFPLGHNGIPSDNTGKGMMLSIWVDEGDHSLIYAGSHHGGLWKTTDGGQNWFPLHDDDVRIHGVNSIAVDPVDNDIVYITGNTSLGEPFSKYSSGLFKSTDGGDSWDQLNPGINYPTSNQSSSVRQIIVDPTDPDNLYLISYRNVFRSKDKGANWETVFFKKYDHWNDSTSYMWHNGLWDFEIAPWDTSMAYLAGSEIFKIENPVGTFDTTNISDDVFLIGLDTNDYMIDHPHRCEISMHSNYPGTVWFCYACRYERSGVEQDWDRIVSYDDTNGYQIIYDMTETYFGPGLSASKLEFAVSPSDPEIFYLGGIGIYKIDANQIPAERINIADNTSGYPDSCWIHVDMRDMQIFSDSEGNDTLYLANDAGISWGTLFKGGNGACSDNSWNWRHPCTSIENGLNVTEYYGIGLSESAPDLMAGGCQDLSNMLQNGDKWVNFGDGDGSEVTWDPNNPNIFYFSEWQLGLLYRTNDLGADPKQFFDMAKESLFIPLELDPRDSSILYSGDTNLYKFTGINDFSSPVSHQTIHDFSYGITDIEAVKAYINSTWFYVSTLKSYHSWSSPPSPSQYSECIYRMEANGSSAYDISPNLLGCLDGVISDIETDPDDKYKLWVAFAGYSVNSSQKKKVYTSANGGNSWQDYSQGLPLGMPVFEIRYIPEYDYLLAATDVGIFKRTTQDTAWYPFSQNLPAGKIVTDLEVNLEYNTIVASTFGRGLWKTAVKCEYNETPWTIRQDLIWERDTILDRSIVVADTVTLTIRNCRIYMPADAKILVQRGATLILDNCTLTSACNDLWWGVEVWGNNHYSQATSVQGKVEMKNNALIEKARKAIFCGKNIENTYPDWAYTGGIVDARQSFFKNNRYGVQLWAYHYPQIMCKFQGCNFQTTQALADGSSPEYFITLVQVNGVEIAGCDFEYTIDGEPDFTKHGRGIYSLDAGYSLIPNPINNDKDTLENLDYGVFALKLYENQPIDIHDAYFVKNLTGVYASGIETLDLYSNKFLVDTDSIPSGTQIYGGVYLDHCTGFIVEENYFHGNLGLIDETNSIGITINNSGDANNEIYKNTFYRMFIGTLAQNINRNSKDPDAGLKLNCNVYNLNEYDIAVTGSQGCSECGIARNQGSPSVPAGNLFSKTGIHPTSDFDNQMDSVFYYHHRAILGGTNLWIPLYISDSVFLIPTLITWYDTTCSSRLASKTVEISKNLYETSLTTSDSLNNLLQQLVDGGNTSLLEMDVTFAEPDDALDLHDELLTYSPYLSDTILIKSAEKEDVLAPVMVKEIMVANPQSAKSTQVLEALGNRQNPLPDYMMAEIMQGKDSVAHKELLESDLSWWDLQKEVAMNQLIHYYNMDTSLTSRDSIIVLLEDANSLHSQYRLMMAYFEKGDTISAISTFESIPDQFDLNASQSVIHQHWSDLIDVVEELKHDSSALHELDSLQLASLAELCVFEDLPGTLSRNMLYYLGKAETGPYYILPENRLKSDYIKPGALTDPANKIDSFIKFYPNPAKNYIIVEYTFISSFDDGLLFIYSSDGKLQFSKSLDKNKHDFIINTRDWEQGVYFYKFVNQGDSGENGKIIILK